MDYDDGIYDMDLEMDETATVSSTVANNILLKNNGLSVVVSVRNEYGLDYEPQAEIVGNTVKVYNDRYLAQENVRLLNLVNDFEAANIRRQGEIEKLRAELIQVHDSYRSKLNAKTAYIQAQSTELSKFSKAQPETIVDYSLVDPELLQEYAIRMLGSEDLDNIDELQEQIENAARFHPHVQQQIVTDDKGVKRFRKNKLVEILVDSFKTTPGMEGFGAVSFVDASREDRAQLAQLIGYSVDGYQSLSYALPVQGEEE